MVLGVFNECGASLRRIVKKGIWLRQFCEPTLLQMNEESGFCATPMTFCHILC